MTTPDPRIPHARLDIEWPAGIERLTDKAGEYARELMLAKAAEIRANGERAWFEVRYPLHDGQTSEQREATFDAIEVYDNGTIVTLPPYAVLLGEETR